MNTFVILALALAPTTAVMIYIYLRDRHEPEPLGLLAISFLYGGVSTMLTLLISFPVNALILTKADDDVHLFLNAFFKVALVEEFSKFFFVRFILFYNKNFNEPYDGIVYAVMVSMGFATLENVMYVYQFGFTTGIMRMFTAVPAHATFAIIMGYFLGKAKFTHRKVLYFSIVSLLAATALHGTYDYLLFISHVPGLWIGAVISLVIIVVLSRKAIRLHDQSSPFITDE
jgi:protease PrsW